MYMTAGDQVASMLGFLDQGNLLHTPFINKACQSFQVLNLLAVQQVPTLLMSAIPPHVDLSSSICMDLLNSVVNLMPPQFTKNGFQDFWKQYYPQHLQIYTDRSRTTTGSVSAGLYVPSTQLAAGWLLNPMHTVLGAELFAIYQAVQLAIMDVSLQNNPVLILSVS
jgi:hypothetical protein